MRWWGWTGVSMLIVGGYQALCLLRPLEHAPTWGSIASSACVAFILILTAFAAAKETPMSDRFEEQARDFILRWAALDGRSKQNATEELVQLLRATALRRASSVESKAPCKECSGDGWIEQGDHDCAIDPVPCSGCNKDGKRPHPNSLPSRKTAESKADENAALRSALRRAKRGLWVIATSGDVNREWPKQIASEALNVVMAMETSAGLEPPAVAAAVDASVKK